jgi:heme exporter protein A
MNPNMSGIRGFQLSKSYHHYRVLKEITFEVSSGECYCLFGPNGAGKTTLLKILATLKKPSSGRFEVMGFDGISERSKAREKLLLVSHGSYLYNDLNAVENIRFALALRSISPTAREIKVALDRVGIGAFSEFKVRYFSEGMKKRLAMAKSILSRPQVLLMDEPYSALDEPGMSIVNEFIGSMTRQGTAVMMASHNRVKSAEVAQRVGVLQDGTLREMTVEELVAANELF